MIFEKLLQESDLYNILDESTIIKILELAKLAEYQIIIEQKKIYCPYAVFYDEEPGFIYGKISNFPDKKVHTYCRNYEEAQMVYKYYK